MARVDVIMPQMGESIAEGTLSRWLKKVGDSVKRDEPIFEISTDKVDAEIPSPTEGVLGEILVQEGETVEVQTVVARIETDATADVTSSAAAPTPAAPTPAPQAPAAAPTAKVVAPSAPPASSPVRSSNGAESAEERLRRKSTPLVRKMVAEHNLDLASIPGTGVAGRVTKQDVLTYLERGTPAPPSVPGQVVPATVPSTGPVPTSVHVPEVDAWDGDRVEPWSRIRKLTADHMVLSRRVSAHVASVMEIDFTRVAQVRAQRKQEYRERGVNLTFLAFITKVIANTLRQHPVVNAAVSGESTIYRRDINIGIAVALEWGLIVPVIRHADELSLLGLARAINDLGERARSKRLSPDEVQKGTFTITNPGVFGSYVGLPIINQPQSAILAVGAIEKRPAVLKAADGTDTLGIRTMGMLAMSYDHRIVDGSDADRFLADVKRGLQEFADSSL